MPYIKSVFISGRFTDLQTERSAIIKSLVNLGLMPITMEQFHADYRDKESYIEERIREADFFAVIIGNTYGDYKSQREKISFTEWEYDLAQKYGKKTMAFVCSEDSNESMYDVDAEKAKHLKDFKDKVMAVPLVGKFRYGDIRSLELEVTNAFKEYGYIDKSRSRYSGLWVSEISPVNQLYPYKSDEWTFYGKNGYVFGTIRRLLPKKDHRHWEFTGLEFGDQLLVSFAEIDKTTISAGIVLVRKDTSVNGILKGFYYEFSKLDSNDVPIPIPIILKRKPKRKYASNKHLKEDN